MANRQRKRKRMRGNLDAEERRNEKRKAWCR